jgi:predicted metalloprotease with PDZ domain
MEFVYASAGEWAFTDEEAAEVVGELLEIHGKVLGGVPRRRASVMLLPLPRPGGANVWAAETRGATVALVSGRLPSKVAALAQLNGALTHETLHLWVPNGLALEGEYDWFYEGFTNYQALRVGMRRGQLRFQDYLGALGRAFDAYQAARGGRELSLAQASRERWSGGSAAVYQKGMLVAFLYDLKLMLGTGGRNSLDDAYRELFRRFGGERAGEEGNAAVAAVLGGLPGMADFTERFVRQPTAISLASAVAPFGLVVEPGGVRTHLGVSPDLERPQRELLRKLGYNENHEAESRKLRERMRRRPN